MLLSRASLQAGRPVGAYFEDADAEAAAFSGVRALCAQTILKFPTAEAAGYEDGLASARAFIAAWKAHSLSVPSVRR
ncbi:MAG: hypothetical protein WEB50_15660 [Vicinamibacterales bacterium]